ncbi:mitochondrial 54S ribosomal protein uL22m [Aspergillus melleus]|uniref:mitochondrial 54S ribosomal protein uL22m n=1 Tax=Aspergillus melleus TaxID=138277 RepID=UPI001E8DF434|nr:39S ribosomal protein L22, mitochondrial [Aspergillus melleus]KAH8423447.1 39S ribosomal protein L22, mitochondrial [Aspergillus melleus]
MASMAALNPYGHLIRSARTGVTYLPRRTLTYTVPRFAQEDGPNGSNNQSDSPQPKGGALSSIKNFFFGGKSAAEKPKITRRANAPLKREGSLSADSIFAEDEASPKLIASGRTPSRRTAAQPAEGEEEAEYTYAVDGRNRETMQTALDPRPNARVRWERKMVIREVRRRGRISKTEQILRTERESTSKSHWFKTSVKKLGPLARQIAGKNIDEAMLQMRFSKKKAAKDVLEHLQHAKNVAIVRSGMGLGAASDKGVTITLKSGQRKTITDPTAIYIEQAWVNRGPYGYDYDHRARGQINMLRPPYTSLSVVLKEEKTRIREWQVREAESQRKRKTQLWTQLPDRKISAQNQYYSW